MFKNNSSQISELISPVHGCRDALRRKGFKPKNHHKDNLSYIKTLNSAKSLKKPPVKRPSSMILGKNYIQDNIKSVKKFQVQVPEDSDSDLEPLGRVPEYISSIKLSLSQTKAEQDYEDSKKSWPAGTRLLTADERQEKIENLQKEKEDLIQKYNSLPFTSDTNATKARRSAIEVKLKELDFHLDRLSVSKVFYPI